MKNGQILINLFNNIKVLSFLSKLHFESEKMRYCQMKLVIWTQTGIFWAKNGQNHQFELHVPQE
jgi:hypothetical protein